MKRMGTEEQRTAGKALARGEDLPPNLQAALDKKRGKTALDPVSEAAMEVVNRDLSKEEQARHAQQERESKISEINRIIGRIQGVNLLVDFGNVASLVWLKDVKAQRVYQDVPGIGTWDKFCESIGISRRKVDEDLLNLQTFGEAFLGNVANFRVGYRDLRKLRQLTHDGQVIIEAEAVVIGGESIPFDPEHREELEAALERVIEAKDQVIKEQEAVNRANVKLINAKQELLRRQERDLARYEGEAEQRGLTASEQGFIQECDNARTTIDGFLNRFDPSINPLPEDATPHMRATLMHTLAWFKRRIIASFDTAGELYGEPEMDDDWVPPHLRKQEQGAEG